jgi:site-specific recombinase XerD
LLIFDVREITPALIAEFISVRQKEHAANATINRELAAIRMAFSLAVEREVIDYMPRIRSLKEPPARQGFFE